MNRYGVMAERHWRRWLPSRVAAMDDPASFFSELGEEVATGIEDLTADLAGDDPPGEKYLEKVGRLNMARLRAEEMVLAEMVLLPSVTPADTPSQPSLWEVDGLGEGCGGQAAPPVRFRPFSQEDLAPSGSLTRVRANVEAVATLRAIEREGRTASASEQAVLARWSGWGAVPETFDASREDLAWARQGLADLLSEEELAAAARNTLNAHYTDAALVQEIWGAARRLGFIEGRVLEPGCGSGNFVAFAPERAQMVGVELEACHCRHRSGALPRCPDPDGELC